MGRNRLVEMSVVTVLTAAAFSVWAHEEPPAAAQPSQDAQTAPAEPAASDKSVGHYTMGHSPADNKSMNSMKDKTVRIHHPGDAPAESSTADKSVGHYTMGHSPADNKSMNSMKDKTVRIHYPGDAPEEPSATKPGASAPPK